MKKPESAPNRGTPFIQGHAYSRIYNYQLLVFSLPLIIAGKGLQNVLYAITNESLLTINRIRLE